MQKIINKDEKMRQIFETVQKVKNGTIKTAKRYNSIDEFVADISKK